MAIPVVVPDASVILKWVLRGPDEESRVPALRLKDAWLEGSLDVVVPTLWIFEVGNVLGLKQPAGAHGLLQAVMDLALPEEPAAAYTEDIFRLMHEYDVTFYDAAYHALAIVRRGTMVTADRRYVSRCRSAGHINAIEDWASSSGLPGLSSHLHPSPSRPGSPTESARVRLLTAPGKPGRAAESRKRDRRVPIVPSRTGRS